MRNILALLLSILFSVATAAQSIPATQSLVLTHVTIIDMTGSAPKPDMTVVITGNRIAALGKSGEIPAPPNARVVDASGKFLIPGLWDMHAHTTYARASDVEKTFLPLLVANGVTGIRNMGSTISLEQINRWRRSAAEGNLLAPRIVIGQQIDGVGAPNVSSVYRVKSESEARAAVQRIKREGFDFVKVYSRLSREMYFAVAEEARQQGIPFAGHVPASITLFEASNAGQKSIEHMYDLLTETSTDEARLRKAWVEREARILALKGKPMPPELEEQEFTLLAEALDTYSEEKAARLFAVLARNVTYECPTIVIHRTWGSLAAPTLLNDPRLRYVPVKQRGSVNFYLDAARTWSAERKSFVNRLYQTRLKLILAMRRAGVEIIAGTDTAYGYPVAGFALHDELELYVQAGLTPMEALRTATYNPAKYFGQLDSLGTIEPGKFADLVLLDANPLESIANTQRINAVVLNGRFLPREVLQSIFVAVEAAANKK
jgi:imidazolonepropionase-like amidohydrolase